MNRCKGCDTVQRWGGGVGFFLYSFGGTQGLLSVLSDFGKANVRFDFACDLVKANLEITHFTFLCYYTRIQSYVVH